MTRAAIRGPRGQLAPSGAGGAAAAALLLSYTEGGIWYGSRGSQRSVIGRCLQPALASAGGCGVQHVPHNAKRGGASVPPLTRISLFFAPRALNPLISNNCARPRDWEGRCYLLLRGVTSGVTRKSLFPHGFRGVLPCYRLNGPLDVHAGAHARASATMSFHGNIGNNGYYSLVSEAWALLRLLPPRHGVGNTVTMASVGACSPTWSNILWGGYSVELAGAADQHRPAGSARRNFRAPRLAAGGLDRRGWSWLPGGAGNGGKLPFSGSGSGAVGTVPLERSGQGIEAARLFGTPHKLCQQAHRLGLARVSAEAGGHPPQPADRSLRGLALDVGRIWIGLPHDRMGRPLNSIAQQGLGVSGRHSDGSPGRDDARGIFSDQNRVGDGGASGSGWQSELPATFSWEAAHVNG